MLSRSTRRLWYFRAIALFASGVASLALSELAFRIWNFGPAIALSPSRMDSITTVGHSGWIQAGRHPRILYEASPNVDDVPEVVCPVKSR